MNWRMTTRMRTWTRVSQLWDYIYRDLGFSRGHEGHQKHWPHDGYKEEGDNEVEDDDKLEDNNKDDNNNKDDIQGLSPKVKCG